MKVCGVCGKRIAVMWPEFWVYKHGKGEDTTYYCSENCMIVADTREMKDRIGWVDPQAEMTEEEIEAVTHGRPVGFRRLRKTARREEQPAAPAGQERTGQEMGNSRNAKKLTREEKEKAVELAIAGKDPIGYLKECGAKNPWASWAYIKQTLKKAKPEKYAQLPGDDDRLGEEVSFGAQAAPAADPPVPADEPEAADPLEGFEAVPVNQQKAPEADLTIKAEDLQAAEDPAVAKMDAFINMEQKLAPAGILDGMMMAVRDRSRVLLDKNGTHAEPMHDDHPDAVRMGLFQEKDGLQYGPLREGAETETLFGLPCEKEPRDAPKKPDWEKTTFFGIPCEVTGMKVEEFEFRRIGNDLMMDYPGPGFLWMDKSLATVKLTVEQWKRVIELVPKVMKIFGMD